MAGIVYTLAALSVAVSAAPPPLSPGQHIFSQQQRKYIFDFPDESYYNQAQHRPDYQANAVQNRASGRLEQFEDPNNQVEIIQPQQSPQQPAAPTPNIPGIAPGQRVYVVHMPVPGYRPGTISGYQPIYIVAASPNGNPAYQQPPVYPQEGGSAPLGPQFVPTGVQQPGFIVQRLQPTQQNRAFLLPYNVFQEPVVYEPVHAVTNQPQNQQTLGLNQYVGLNTQVPNPASQTAALRTTPTAESKRDVSTTSSEEKTSTAKSHSPSPKKTTQNVTK